MRTIKNKKWIQAIFKGGKLSGREDASDLGGGG